MFFMLVFTLVNEMRKPTLSEVCRSGRKFVLFKQCCHIMSQPVGGSIMVCFFVLFYF